MTTVDWIIVGVTLLMALWGYAQGLIVGALALLGFAAGAFAGARLGPLLLEGGSESPYAPLSALIGALLLGGLIASGLEMLGFHLRQRLGDRLGLLDGIGGAILIGCLGLALAWIAGAVALQTPGARTLREDIQRSTILRELNAVLPPSGPILNALARFDPIPRVNGPAADVPPPTGAVARDPEVDAAGRSVVRVLGNACGLGVQGSGWIAADGIVVTNAHVVAGTDDTTVQLEGAGGRHDAQAVFFDPSNDVAVLRSSGISGTPSLELDSEAASGTPGAILGFPQNGGYDVQPARLGPTETSISQDAYGRGPIQREITSFRGLVRSGNSGGPVVDEDGRVMATVFAASTSHDGVGYGVPDSIVERAVARADAPVDTGPCVR